MRYEALTLFVILGFGLMFGLFYTHESVHQEIFRQNEMNSSIKFEYLIFPVETIADKPCPDETCRIGHYLNEIIGYQLLPFYLLLFFGLLIIIWILEKKIW